MSTAAPERTLHHPPNYAWTPQPAAQAIVNEAVSAFLAASPSAAKLADRMRHDAGTRFLDWLDFIELPDSGSMRARLTETGFTPMPGQARAVFEHHGGLFPLIVLSDTPHIQIGIKVDSISDFLATWSITNDYAIEGAPFAPVRRVTAFRDPDATLWVVERHGTRGLDVPEVSPERCLLAIRHFEAFRRRHRDWPEDEQGWNRVNELVDAAVRELGPDFACDLFFRAEREYWQRRNRAARVQKARQDELGLGWANHDHHTYRSSRVAFARLVGVLRKLGFVCRERFYAGHEAGWGAQVLEQPECGLVVFADVDLSEEEVSHDFSTHGLTPRDFLGTVGLWVGLHGESMLQAGLHHLECQFDHDSLRDQLRGSGIQTMMPFTDLPYLKQAFTEGERWPVSDARVARLLERGLITPQQAVQFRAQGAIGSHLENLQRENGFKGFNQKGVSDIIGRTDPRHHITEESLLGA